MNAHPQNRPKQAWEMTRAEVRGLSPNCTLADLKAHSLLVADAVQTGKPVPKSVLQDYPELKQKGTIPELAYMAT